MPQKEFQDRLKSKVLWVAVSALVALLMTQYGLWQFVGMDETVFTKVVEMILAILGIIGIINNPTNPTGI